jgi:hypothetical protein
MVYQFITLCLTYSPQPSLIRSSCFLDAKVLLYYGGIFPIVHKLSMLAWGRVVYTQSFMSFMEVGSDSEGKY